MVFLRPQVLKIEYFNLGGIFSYSISEFQEIKIFLKFLVYQRFKSNLRKMVEELKKMQNKAKKGQANIVTTLWIDWLIDWLIF